MVRAEIETAIHLENAVKMIKRFTNSNVSLKKIHINLDRKNPSFFKKKIAIISYLLFYSQGLFFFKTSTVKTRGKNNFSVPIKTFKKG